jgi:protein required for attachment to host cells
MLRWLMTVVVSDAEKAHLMRQEGIRKTVRSLGDEIAVEVS